MSADLRDGAAQISVRVRHNLRRARGEGSLRVRDVELAPWIGYALPSHDYRVMGGHADALASLTYDLGSKKPPKVGGSVWLHKLALVHKDILVPLEAQDVALTFDLQRINLTSARTKILGNVLFASGQIDISDPKAPKLDLKARLPRVDLQTLVPLAPDLAPFDPSGWGEGVLHVYGEASDPVVDIACRLEDATLMKQRIGPAFAKIRYHHLRVEVSQLSAAVHGGRAFGKIWLTLDQTPDIGGTISFQGVDLARSASPYLPRTLPLAGKVAGKLVLWGPMHAMRIAGNATLSEASYGRQKVSGGGARFEVFRGNTTVSEMHLDLAGGGALNGDVGYDEGGDLVLDIDTHPFDLASLRKVGIDVAVSGRAFFSLAGAGSVSFPDSLEAKGQLTATNGSAYGQPIDDVTCAWQFAAGQLTLENILGHTAGGLVLGKGSIGTLHLGRAGPAPQVRFDFSADKIELGRIPALTKASGASLGEISGRVWASAAQLRVDQMGLSLKGKLTGQDLVAPRGGDIASIRGDVGFRRNTLSLSEFQIVRGPAKLQLAGEVVFGKEPVYSLLLTTRRTDIRSLLAIFNWEQLLAGTVMAPRETNSPSREDPTGVFELPDRQNFTYDPAEPLDLAAIYSHWLGAHKEPLLASKDEATKPVRPFWESLDGIVDAEIRLDGTAVNPYVFAKVEVLNGKAFDHPLKNASMLAWYGRGEMVVDHLDLKASEGGAIQVKGALGKGRAIEVTASSLALGWLNPWLVDNEMQLGGEAEGTITVTGELSRPRLAIKAFAKKGRISDFIYDVAKVEANFEGGVLAIRQAAIEKDGKEAKLTGTVPIGQRPGEAPLNLTLDVRGNSLGIVSILSKGLIDWRGGDGTLIVDIVGTQADPRLRGALKLEGARLAVATLKEEFTDIEAQAQIGAGIVKVEKFAARHGGGRLEASGFLTMKQFKLERYLLDVYASEVGLRLSNGLFEGQVDGHVSVGGKFERPAITGELVVSKGKLTLNPGQGDKVGTGGETPIELSGLNLGIKDSVTVFQQNLINVRIAGNLVINGSATQPDLKGVVKLIPGGTITTFYTNEFKVADGAVEFLGSGRAAEESDLYSEILEERPPQTVGAGPLNARVRVVATGTALDDKGLHTDATSGPALDGKGTAKAVKVTAIISGTLTDLKYSFQSDPPVYTQKEIETLLGKPSLVTRVLEAGAVASGLVATASVGTKGFAGVLQEVAPGFINFLAKQWLNPLFDPILGPFLQDYSLDLISDPRQEATLPFNLALSAETKSVGPLSATYRRVINTNRQGAKDPKRYGVNVSGIPLNIRLEGPLVNWATPHVLISDLTIATYLEDTAGATDEFPPLAGIDWRLAVKDSLRPPETVLSLFRSRDSDPWRASIQIGFRGRL